MEKNVPTTVKHINMLKYLAIKKVMVTCYPRVGDENILCIHTHMHTYIGIFTRGMGG